MRRRPPKRLWPAPGGQPFSQARGRAMAFAHQRRQRAGRRAAIAPGGAPVRGHPGRMSKQQPGAAQQILVCQVFLERQEVDGRRLPPLRTEGSWRIRARRGFAHDLMLMLGLALGSHTLQVRPCSRSYDAGRQQDSACKRRTLPAEMEPSRASGGTQARTFFDAPRRARAAREYCDLRAGARLLRAS